MSWIKPKIIGATIAFLIGFITLEVGIRIIHKYIINSNKFQYEQYSQIYSDERSKDYLYWHKPNISVKLEKGYYDFTFKTNVFGHRANTDNVKFENSIVFVGDSIVEGASVENDEMISSLFTQKSKVPAINLGLGSSNTIQQYFLLEDKYQNSMNADWIVLGFCLNDLQGNDHRIYFDSRLGNWKLHDYVLTEDDSYRFDFGDEIDTGGSKSFNLLKSIARKSEAMMLIYRLLKHNIFEENYKLATDQGLENTEFFLKKIKTYAENKGSKFMVLIFPYKSQVEKKDNPNFSPQNQIIEILEENNILYIDLYNDFKKAFEQNTSRKSLFHDNIHPNAKGTEVIVDSLIHFLGIEKS